MAVCCLSCAYNVLQTVHGIVHFTVLALRPACRIIMPSSLYVKISYAGYIICTVYACVCMCMCVCRVLLVGKEREETKDMLDLMERRETTALQESLVLRDLRSASTMPSSDGHRQFKLVALFVETVPCTDNSTILQGPPGKRGFKGAAGSTGPNVRSFHMSAAFLTDPGISGFTEAHDMLKCLEFY